MTGNTLSLRRLLKSGYWAFPIYICLVALLALLVARPLDNMAQDLMVSSASPFTDHSKDIVIVTITEDTIAQFPYRSPIDRSFIADLVAKLVTASPRVIALDILFDQPTEPDKDQKLSAVLQSSDVPIVVASAGDNEGLSSEQVEYLEKFAPKTVKGLARLLRDPTDGVVRSLYVGERSDSGLGFAASAARASGFAVAPSPAQYQVFYRNANSQPALFRIYPAHSVRFLPKHWLEGKIVLVGVDLRFDDRHLTPFALLNGTRDGTLPGVVIHAHGLSQLLKGDRIISVGIVGIGVTTVLFILLTSWLMWRPFPTLLKPLVILLSVIGFWLLALVLFSNFGVLVPVALPTIALLSVSSLFAFMAWQRDRDGRIFIQSAFSRYVSPGVVKEIIDHPGNLKLGGERRFITSICTDLESFTQFSENHEPEQVAATLNQYLSSICGLFTKHGATIDKIVGDAVIGFFGAPVSQPQQADRAVQLALAIDKFSEDFQHSMLDQGIAFGATRIGVHSGPAVVGNFGGERFFDYTAVGDTVNTASRLEGANKTIGTRICISETVAQASGSIDRMRPSACLQLMGKGKFIQVFEPLQPEELRLKNLARYIDAYEQMRSGSPKAGLLFKKLSELVPDDQLVSYHSMRLAAGDNSDRVILDVK